jgi:hypothetical protein
LTTITSPGIDTGSIADQRKSSQEDFDSAVGDLFHTAADAAGLLDEEGRIAHALLDQRIYDELKTKHVVSIDPDNDDRRDPGTSSTKDELTAAVFQGYLTIADAEKDDVYKSAYAKCQSTVWNRTQTSKRGTIQKRFEGDKLVLIHGKVFRQGNPIRDGIYVSTHIEVLLRDYWGPRLAKLQKLSDSFQEDFSMMKERVPPEVEAVVRAALESAFVEATAKLPVPTLTPSEPQQAIEA